MSMTPVPSPFTLGFASVRDAAEMAALSRDAIEHGLTWRYRSSQMAQFASDQDTVALVGKEGTVVAGFAVMHFCAERAHLVLLAVQPASRRKGLGRALVGWLLESARTAGVASVHVELRERNRAALALYRDAGFAPSLRMAGYYEGKENAVRMLLLLRRPGGTLPGWELPAAFRRR